MSEFWTSPFAIPIVAIIVGAGVPILARTWGEWAKHQATCALKESMVARGMSADEIERVIAAGREETWKE